MNSLLYKNAAIFTAEGDSPPRWSIRHESDSSTEAGELGSARRANPELSLAAPLATKEKETSDSKYGPGEVSIRAFENAMRLLAAIEEPELPVGPSATDDVLDTASSRSEEETNRSVSDFRRIIFQTDLEDRGDEQLSVQLEIQRLAREFPGITYQELALLAGVPEDAVRVLARSVKFLILDEKSAVESEVPTERHHGYLEAIRTASTMEFPLSSDAYDELVRRGFVDGVTSTRLGQVFGSWRRACELAGVESQKPLRENYESKWTDQELAESVAQFLMDFSFHGAHHRYDEWRRLIGDSADIPSSGTLRNRLGPSWENVRRRGLEVIRQRWLASQDSWLSPVDEEESVS